MRLETLNKEISNILSTLEFEEDGEIHITGADWFSDDLRIEFAIKTGIKDQNQLWEVQINGVRKEVLKSAYADNLELFEEHPLLWDYNQIQTSLYFGHFTTRPYELFANVYETHILKTKEWIPFEKYINPNLSIIELCKSQTGLFASGPIKLLEAYKKDLELHDMKPTIVGEYIPKRWLNEHEVDETEIVKVLIIGESYIIAETFDFNRV